MRYCPECGGELKYISATKRYVCRSCGLSLTPQELIELRKQLRPRVESEEEQRRKERTDYLKWWLGKKK
jgi:tRNA(Ile2) C34 agmatinyltransferase TiaS